MRRLSKRGCVQAAAWNTRAGHELKENMEGQQGIAPSGAMREAVLAWLAAAAYFTGAPKSSHFERRRCTDAFASAPLAIALRFCRPLTKSPAKFLARLDPTYYKASVFR